jgi:hypothetical protein
MTAINADRNIIETLASGRDTVVFVRISARASKTAIIRRQRQRASGGASDSPLTTSANVRG